MEDKKDTVLGENVEEQPWVSADVAAAMAGGSPEMGKQLPDEETDQN